MAPAETDDTSADNVTRFPGAEPQRPKDPTNAERQARWRESRRNGSGKKTRKNKRKQEARASTVTGPMETTVTPANAVGAVTEEVVCTYPASAVQPVAPVSFEPLQKVVRVRDVQPGRGIRFAALIAALGLATVSAGFSITGMTSIFVGAFLPVIAMGVALEAGKLSAVAWLGHQRGAAPKPLRAALGVLVVVLMGLNAVGCYGFLAKAHIGHQVEGETAVGARAADIEARISVQADQVADLDRRIGQIDGAVDKTTAKGRTNAAMQLAADQRRNRAELAAQRDQANKTLAELKVEKAGIEGAAPGGRRRPGPGPVPGDLDRRRQRNGPTMVRARRQHPARSGRRPPPPGRHKALIPVPCTIL